MSAVSPRLTLTVRDAQAVSGSTQAQASFATEGGRIGRDAACDWVLEGEGVSRLHASVRHLDGVYFIEDHSTNGVLHNGVPLRAGFPVPLHAGDALRIDAFEIDVAVSGASGTAVTAATQSWNHAEPCTLSAMPLPQQSQHAPLEHDVFADLGASSTRATDTDPLALFATSFTLAGRDGDAAAFGLGHAPATAEAYRAPVAVPAAGGVVLPEHWDLTRSEFALPPAADPVADMQAPLPSAAVPIAAAAPAPAPTPTPTPTLTPSPLPTSVLQPRGAAVAVNAAAPSAAQPVGAHTPDTPELPALFAAMTAGLMDVLRARAAFKNSLRVPVTLIQRTENNPLKFAATVDEAVARLLAPPSPGYLTGTAAIEEAMEDIGRHQLALLAGMRAAFEHVFAQFDPARFEADTAGSALGSWGNRPWRRYAQHYRELLGDPDERFRRLFGEEFARAYEHQMARAKAQAQPADGDRA
ncbi:TPA: type VI secretion system-associated FHA domain protein TagH [Xanthomonas vasicola pv. zeae]|uniref:type VI secretion system-associated FHA domain protein TagH n=2 Tax=Xanthomonas vasicola TaxID=56459 RepID=UPI000E31871F|nr:type VI secretion system-associated FHA domain protein TagH [Xanthomonas vasicola]MBV7305254.1 type VI secretion system-associated FHA domain protein TagH [Xanthomonas vasicola pv. vasculorum]MDO6933858.1 type VI secretion system-associated FHA domain protein TagH [Xanthomonas vasicola]MDO6937632.1 type VI secretion system-associated FHA domain protein TagH [Xanthomonas vasicola]HHZ21282.1 type VI secretion system-associated FHA domain protein TagH [Xanthomonas vasicola pv. zeae]HHZ26019.1 